MVVPNKGILEKSWTGAKTSEWPSKSLTMLWQEKVGGLAHETRQCEPLTCHLPAFATDCETTDVVEYEYATL